MNVRQADWVSVAVLLALVGAGFYLTTLIDLTLSSDLETFTGPRAYPRILLAGMLLLALVQLAKLWVSRDQEALQEFAAPIHPRLTKVLLALLVLAVFATVFEPLGYLITLAPLLIAIGYLNGADSFLKNVLFSIFASAICLVVFRYGLNTVLPEGLLGIDQVF